MTVIFWGAIYLITKRNFKRFLVEVKKTESTPDIMDFGARITGRAIDVTNIAADPVRVDDLIKEMSEKRKAK